jgi:hypothetical protein
MGPGVAFGGLSKRHHSTNRQKGESKMKAKLVCAMLAAAAIAGAIAVQPASAAVIVSPIAVTATNSFPDSTFGTPENLINHGGLFTDFVSGVTDFDAYIAGNPQHTVISAGAEWFTNFGDTGATLTFDLGAVMTIDRVATWVDEFWGAGTITVSLSLDGSVFSGVGSFAPTDWPTTVSSYGADVFSFGAASTRYVRLVLSDCPQPLSSAGGGCGMGEVAVATAETTAVPEPGMLGLLSLGLVGLFVSRRRKR